MARVCRMGIVCGVVLAGLLVGCGGKKSPAKTDGGKTGKTNPVDKTNGKTPPKKSGEKKKPAVTLRPFDAPKTVKLEDVTPKGLQAFIDKQKGRVVLVDYWFVDCKFCRIAFPHTVALSKKYAKDGLVVVSMCVDTLENKPRALKFLQTNKANIVNFYASEKVDPDMLAEEFAVETFPLYRLYGPDGKFLQAISPTEADPDPKAKLDAAVKNALGKE